MSLGLGKTGPRKDLSVYLVVALSTSETGSYGNHYVASLLLHHFPFRVAAFAPSLRIAIRRKPM